MRPNTVRLLLRQHPAIWRVAACVWVAVVLLAAIGAMAACSSNNPPPSGPTTASPQVFVQALMTSAPIQAFESVETMTLESIAARAEQTSALLSSPNVLAKQGERTLLEFPAEATVAPAMNLTRYAVVADVVNEAQKGAHIKMSFDLGFADGNTSQATIIIEAEHPVFIPLTNGLMLVAQGEAIRSRDDLKRVLDRKREAAESRAATAL